MKFSIEAFSSKCDQIRRKLWIWSLLLEKSLMENFIFCAVKQPVYKQLTFWWQIAKQLSGLYPLSFTH